MIDLPSVTFIMPIRNEASFIARSLGAVLAQDYPSERVQVLIVDGISTDDTREEIARLKSSYPDIQIKVLDNPQRIVPTGMNIGLGCATGDVIVRVDGHTIIDHDYARQCVAALGRTGADNVGGRMDAVSHNTFGRAVALATSSRFGVGGARFHYSKREEWVDTVYMGAWPRRTFDQVGFFDEEMVRNQDDEFNYRTTSKGGRILLSPEIKSHYYNRSTIYSLFRQYFQYGYWKVRVLQKHHRQMRLRQFIPPAFVAALLIALCLTPFYSAGRWMLGLVAGLYAVANLTASYLSARTENGRIWLIIPFTFMIVHMAYGLGFLTGIFSFWKHWPEFGKHAFSAGRVEVSGLNPCALKTPITPPKDKA